MRAYKIVKVVSENSTVKLEALPFAAGEVVEITVLPHHKEENGIDADALAGSVLKYDKPFESVAQDDWDVLR